MITLLVVCLLWLLGVVVCLVCDTLCVVLFVDFVRFDVYVVILYCFLRNVGLALYLRVWLLLFVVLFGFVYIIVVCCGLLFVGCLCCWLIVVWVWFTGCACRFCVWICFVVPVRRFVLFVRFWLFDLMMSYGWLGWLV